MDHREAGVVILAAGRSERMREMKALLININSPEEYQRFFNDHQWK